MEGHPSDICEQWFMAMASNILLLLTKKRVAIMKQLSSYICPSHLYITKTFYFYVNVPVKTGLAFPYFDPPLNSTSASISVAANQLSIELPSPIAASIGEKI